MATITCPYCKARSHMTELHGSLVKDDNYYIASVSHRCDECYQVSIATRRTREPRINDSSHIRAAFNESDEPISWEPKSVLGKSFPDIPGHISPAASEAFECYSIGAYRGAVMLARAVIEASAKDKGVTDGTLFKKIDTLVERGDVRALMADAAHEVRMAGNDMAHGDFATEEITEEDAEEILGFMEDFLREMFEIPTRVKRRKDRRSQAG